tara:strand:- start:821 stop:1210 length:390 start_codon:yes stop_codon:yes gene_type:complete
MKFGESAQEEEKQNIKTLGVSKLVDINHMTKINIEKDRIKFENLYKSFFAEIKNITEFNISKNQVSISRLGALKIDPAEVELKLDGNFKVIFWDGYSMSDIYETKDYLEAQKIFKKYAKKLAKNIRSFQ